MWKKLKIVFIILFILLLIPFAALFFLSLADHRSMHEEVVVLINEQLGGEITVDDVSVSYFRRFPELELRLIGVEVAEKDQRVIRIGRLDALFPLTSLFRPERKIHTLFIREAEFFSRIDSLGNRPRFLERKEGKKTGPQEDLSIEKISIYNSRVYFSNAVKGNRTGITIENGTFGLQSRDTLLVITGEFDGRLDSLVSNNSVLFSNQPVRAMDVRFLVNPATGFKILDEGYLLAHTLKLLPRLQMMPYDDGQQMEFHITGDGNFDTFLELFAFHFGVDLQQTNPDALLHLSYNQKGFVNPFQRPYSELDFEIFNGKFGGAGLPEPIYNVHIKGNYNNGEGHSPETVQLEIDTIHAEMKDSFVNARLKLSNLKDPFVDGHFIAGLDLHHLWPRKTSLSMEGRIDLDLEIYGRVRDLRTIHLEGKQFARGKIEVKDLGLLMQDNAFRIEQVSGSSLLNNHLLEVTRLVGDMNESAFRFEGLFENLDRFILGEHESLEGAFNLRFDRLDLRSESLKQMMNKRQGQKKNALNLGDLALRLSVEGKEILTDYGSLGSFTLESRISRQELQIQTLLFEYQEGDVRGSGKILLEPSGIRGFDVTLAAGFQQLDLQHFLPEIPGKKTGGSSSGTFKWPENGRVKIDLDTEEVIYKDLKVGPLDAEVASNEKSVILEKFHLGLPFGDLSAHLMLEFQRKNAPFISGMVDLDIDSLQMDEFLALKAFGITMKESDRERGRKTSLTGNQVGLPDYMDVQLNMTGKYLTYKNADVSDVDLVIRYMPDSIDLKTLKFSSYGGDVHVYGHLTQTGSNTLPGYLYSKVEDLDLSRFFRAFGNFNQDVFTADNTAGKVSWAMHYYFELDPDKVPVRDKNLWIIQMLVHDAELDKIEPIEKTLFFVGHKAKDKMIIKSLNINAFLVADKMYFRDVLMNDNIANLDLYGEVDLDDRTMDMGIEISLSDLFFRSKKKRIVNTEQGDVELDEDAKVFLNLSGPLTDHKIKLMNGNRFDRERRALNKKIMDAQQTFREKQ